MPTKLAIEDLTSALAVGSLTFLGLFFIVDHFFELWTLFEAYTGDTTWTVVLAIPTLVIIYAIGLFIMNFAEVLFNKLNKINDKEEIENFTSIALTENSGIIQRYFDLKRFQQFFQSCALSLIVLGIGICSTAKWIPGYEAFAYILGLGVFIIALLCPLIAKRYLKLSIMLNEHIKMRLKADNKE